MPNYLQGLAGARVLQALSSNNETTFRRVFNEEFVTTNSFALIIQPQGVLDLRAGLIIERDSTIHIFVSGVQGDIQGRQVALGYADVRRGNQNFPYNSFFYRIGSDIKEALGQIIGRLGGRSIRFWGHSAGGGTVECAAQLSSVFRVPITSITTYGAPKPGEPGCCLENELVERTRYMAWNDYVPLIPQGNLPRGVPRRIALGIVVHGASPWRCQHGSGGVLLSTGRASAAQDATGDVDPAAGLERWINGEALERTAHSINNYVFALAAVVRENPVAPPAIDADVVDRRLVLDRQPDEEARVVLGFRQSAVSEVPGISWVIPIDLNPPLVQSEPAIVIIGRGSLTNTSGTTVRALTGVGKMAQAKLTGRLRMMRVKVGTRWGVVWNDFLIAVFSTPSSARTFCSTGNRFLRLMGNRGTIYMPIFVDAFASFIAIAAAGDPDYRPPLRVES